jgi:creatinine amidohydrolase
MARTCLLKPTPRSSAPSRPEEARLPDEVVFAPRAGGPFAAPRALRRLSIDLPRHVTDPSCAGPSRRWASTDLPLNGHGGNDVPCRAAMCGLKTELPDLRIAFASYWTLAAEEFGRIRTSPRGGMGHACEMETSIMLALDPGRVRLERARNDGTAGETGYLLLDMLRPQPYYMVRNFDEISASGTLGMPGHASAPKGVEFLNAAVEAVCRFVPAFARGELERHAGVS